MSSWMYEGKIVIRYHQTVSVAVEVPAVSRRFCVVLCGCCYLCCSPECLWAWLPSSLAAEQCAHLSGIKANQQLHLKAGCPAPHCRLAMPDSGVVRLHAASSYRCVKATPGSWWPTWINTKPTFILNDNKSPFHLAHLSVSAFGSRKSFVNCNS